MALPDPSSSELPHRRSILLLEEYSALAAAICSVLKKFAPQHDCHVAASVGQANQQDGPELIVIDLDPAPMQLLEFLDAKRREWPNAHLLGIGCGISREFVEARGTNAAVQFVAKPFDVPELGKAVATALTGEIAPLSQIRLADALAVGCVARFDGVVRVTSGSRTGEVHLGAGAIRDAATNGSNGRAALREILSWPEFELRTEAAPVRHAVITERWGNLLADLLGQIAREQPTAPAPRPRRKRATGKKIVVIDDTELLLDFVEEILSAADPDLHIVTAHTGTEGLRRAELMQPDLILLDYSLPDINGDEICRRLLERESTARVPVMMMSGHVAEMNLTAEQCPNVVAKIAKPFLSHDFVTLVERTLAAPPARTAPCPPQPKRNGRKPRNRVLQPQPAAVVPPPTPPLLPAAEAIPEPPLQPEKAAEPEIVAANVGPVEIAKALPLAPQHREIQATPIPATAVQLQEPALVLVSLSMRTVAVQLTPLLRVGRIRARLSSPTVSLDFPPDSRHAALAEKTGFDIEGSDVDQSGRLSVFRLVPNRRPVDFVKTTRRLNIADIDFEDTRAVELVSEPTEPMAMRMTAAFRITAVELTASFAVARLVLEPCGPRVRVTLNGHEPGGPGAIFQISEVHRDAESRVAEVMLDAC